MKMHPRKRPNGQPVRIDHQSSPTGLTHWSDPNLAATVIPDGPMPDSLHGLAFSPWDRAPRTSAAWAGVPGQNLTEEPPFIVPPSMAPAAGVVVLEEDGRVWLVSPTNAFGGYRSTFPKGRLEPGLSLQATAIKEAFEESGLQVEIVSHLIDLPRSATYNRYYLARRVSGQPADMGWESQAVHLVPTARLKDFLNNPNDKPITEALKLLAGKA